MNARRTLRPLLVSALLAPLVAPGGKLILSGILDEIYHEVKGAYEALGFEEVSSKLIGEWRTGLFARR